MDFSMMLVAVFQEFLNLASTEQLNFVLLTDLIDCGGEARHFARFSHSVGK